MNKINSILKEQKSIPIDKFINIALYDKKFGYYIKKNPFGKEGDYITAPLISSPNLISKHMFSFELTILPSELVFCLIL